MLFSFNLPPNFLKSLASLYCPSHRHSKTRQRIHASFLIVSTDPSRFIERSCMHPFFFDFSLNIRFYELLYVYHSDLVLSQKHPSFHKSFSVLAISGWKQSRSRRWARAKGVKPPSKGLASDPGTYIDSYLSKVSLLCVDLSPRTI